MKFPSIKDVAFALRAQNRYFRSIKSPSLTGDDTDVRLQVSKDGSWQLHTGDSSFDQDHRGFWGSGSLDGKRFDSMALAKDLLEQAKEQYATDGAVEDKPLGLGYMQGRGAS